MSKAKAPNIKATLDQLLKDNPEAERKVIEAHLVIAGFSSAMIKAEFKERGLVNKKKGFAADYYNWLAEAVRSKEEVEAYIMGVGEYGETSANTKKHKSHYLSIWEMTVKIHNQK